MKKLLSLILALAMVLSLAACGNKNETPDTPAPTPQQQNNTPANTTDNTPTPEPVADEGPVMPEYSFDNNGTYARADEEEVYEFALGKYNELLAAAKEAKSVDERFVLFAKAEAELLDSAVMIPNTTRGGAYTISRVAPRTVPYVQWGNDDDRLFGTVVSADTFLTPTERNELLDQWGKAVLGEGTYDPVAYLTSKGHTIATDYTTTFSTAPVTLDWLNTSSQSDTEITVNCVDGLVQYNNLSQMTPALAESWDVSPDGLTYTFHIRNGAKWYTSEGAEYADVTANDFVAGFQHMLDTEAGLEWLVDGVVKGAGAYLYEGASFDTVGYEAKDDHTLVITLEQPTSYFLTMLTYSCFLPICDSFYQAHGGVYGKDAYGAASADTNTYTFGKSTDVSSQVYCGPFLIQKLQQDSEIKIVRNPNYYKNDQVMLDSIKWVYDNGENPTATYNDVVAGVYAGSGLTESSGTLALAKADGNFDKYAYISDTNSTTYFGALNLDRGTFALDSGACASPKTEQEKIDTTTALQNKNFRKAMQFAFDKATVNAVSRGEDLKTQNLRNMYCHPEFVSLSSDVTMDGKTFAAGTFYGEIVQYYLDQLGCPIKVGDMQDGWYNPTEAKKCLDAAKSEMEGLVTFPIKIDVVYYSASDSLTAQAQAYKKVIEGTLGTENVVVNLVEATTSADYYASGYRASNGEAGNYDMFYGSGWGPDYGDPSTYLDTFLGEGAGYMCKTIGLF
ncbi:MAG: peptide ABC transporter substrate-binding protein [Oscillospiraceae bacterium]|nr:peptide ABC transporter substrate-binding protein [Oscillospiraceae bacterium]